MGTLIGVLPMRYLAGDSASQQGVPSRVVPRRRRISTGCGSARDLVSEYAAQIHAVSQALIERKVLTGDEVAEIARIDR